MKKTKAKAKKKTKKKTAIKTPAKKKSPAKKATGKVAEKAASVSVGQAVPQFSISATGGKTVDLKGLKGKHVVLYFYPKDSTPGCTLEGQDFSRLYSGFQKANAEVFGISRDSLKSHENFKSKQNYCIDLLSDESEELCSIFGVVKMKNMYGRQVRGIERSTFVIDADGRLVKEWRGVKVDGHAEEVLNFVKTLE